MLDDDPSVLKSTSRLLRAVGHEVETFTDPISFLRYAQTHYPKVVVIDIGMPLMHGLEVQSKLQTISPSTRVIVLTGNDDPLVRGKALNSGASAFFMKPVDVEEFLNTLQVHLADDDYGATCTSHGISSKSHSDLEMLLQRRVRAIAGR
jgi:FixJ family two-component response regulator